jgi:hypothetical protein
MFWDYVAFAIILVIGLVNIIWPHVTAELTWVVRHGIDDEGRKTQEHAMRFAGFMIVLLCGIWLYSQF